MRTWRVPYPKFGAGPGLERVAAIAERLGVDLAGFGQSGAVVVGSNGKGSTAAMTAALLRQTRANSDRARSPRHSGASRSDEPGTQGDGRCVGPWVPDPPDLIRGSRVRNDEVLSAALDGACASATVGLFTSPHLLDLNERFRIDGEDIPDDELEHHWDRVREATRGAGAEETLGGFEFLFLIAADWFAARGCAHTVWEAGIGGRLDPVRLIAARRLALTSLDLEHTDLLGDTLEAIACDKLDAAPEGAVVFVASSCAPQAAAIEAHCGARGVSAVFVDPAETTALSPPLPGAHQHDNAALALRLARDIAPLGDAAAAAGLAATRWPGRLEVTETDTLVVIDVGHTPAGVRAALAGFETMRGERRAVLVCGVSADKDAAAIAAALAPAFAVIVCVQARHKGAPAGVIAAYAQQANPAAEVVIAEGIADARRIALSRAQGGAVYVAGGLFLAAEFKAVHMGRDPASLAFF